MTVTTTIRPVILLILTGVGAVMMASVPSSVVQEMECTATGECRGDPMEIPDHPNHEAPMTECTLYLAPSTIPNAGLGIFTTVAKEVGDKIGNGDLCIPFIDMYWHNGNNPPHNPFRDYFWSGRAMGMAHETATEDIEAYCTGIDCAVNCHLGLVNVQKASPVYDDAGLHRSRDPGAGAFTPYHNGSSYVSRRIPVGGELFKFYGDHWFSSRDYVFGLIPLSQDYPDALTLLQRMDRINQPDAIQEALIQLVQRINTGVWESRTLNAFPRTLADAHYALEEEDMAIIHQPAATRSVEWLQQHGRCVDHIRPGLSTLPQAGRGAFAVRNLPRHTVVAASPLHHVPDETFLHMYKLTQVPAGDWQHDESIQSVFPGVGSTWMRHLDEIVNQQILLNYCYGHEESTVLFCPYGAGINYINHNQSQANLRIQWARSFTAAHNHAIVESGTIEDLEATVKPLLAIEFIATRDIQAGEELFIDYGDIWEEAWLEHVANFEPSGPETYATAHTWNEMFYDSNVRTEFEQHLDPYPENLQIRCHLELRYTRYPQRVQFQWFETDYGYPCRVLDRFMENDIYLYTVQLEIWNTSSEDQDEHHNSEEDEPTVTWIQRTDVPRSALRFFDLPGTTDLHLPGVFRHWIGLPDDMFPQQWRNIR